MSKPVHELAAIIRQYKIPFITKHQPLKQHLSVLNALEKCRTAALGGHVDGGDSCGHLRISYNSCRNRHCPKCQVTNKERWIMARQQQLLPVSYFHVVFTLPQELNIWCMHYPKEMYNLLFAASQQTINTFANDEKHLGAMPGMISVLHTWGDESKQKTMTLEATEFLRRFCLHLLPRGFRKIRYYGFMANVHSALLQVQQKEMGVVVQSSTLSIHGEGKGEVKKISWKLIAKQKLNYDADRCPCCKKGTMVTLFHFKANAPPDAASLQALAELIKGKTA